MTERELFKFITKSRRPHNCKTGHFTLLKERERLQNVKKIKSAPGKRAKLLFFIVKYANLFVLVSVSPQMNAIASRDQFKLIRIGENLVVNYNYSIRIKTAELNGIFLKVLLFIALCVSVVKVSMQCSKNGKMLLNELRHLKFPTYSTHNMTI